MTIPNELLRSGPRPLALSASGRKTLLSSCLNVGLILALGIWLEIQGGGHGNHPSQGIPASMFLRFGVGLLLAAMVGLLRIRSQSRLLRYGRAAVGRVTGDVTPWWYRFRRPRGVRRLQCEFRGMNGSQRKTTVSTRGEAAALNSEIVIVYDRDEPERALLYPSGMLKVAMPTSARRST